VKIVVSSIVLLVALTACGGWVTHEPTVAPAVAAPTIAPGHASTIVVSSYNASSPGSGEVLSFNALGSGNFAPTLSLSGSASGLHTPVAMALGPSGTLYILNSSATGVGPYAVLIFNAGWSSSSAPSGSISGNATTFESPTAMTVDPSGNIYVADQTVQSILVFSAGANGNVSPSRSLAGSLTEFSSPVSGLAANPIDDVYVSSGKSVVAFDPSQNGDVAPTLTLTGKATGLVGPSVMAFLANGTTYIATSKGAGSYPQIEEFSPLEAGDLPPVTEVGGITTQLTAPTAIAIDKAGYMYVANASSCPSETNAVQAPPAILVFAPGTVGDTPPVAVISGSNTSLGCITGIAVY
jgi:hypothetical protein